MAGVCISITVERRVRGRWSTAASGLETILGILSLMIAALNIITLEFHPSVGALRRQYTDDALIGRPSCCITDDG